MTTDFIKFSNINLVLFVTVFLYGCIGTDFINDPTLSKGSINIISISNSLLINDSIKIIVEIKDVSGNTIDGAAINWVSSDEQIASVNPAGCVYSKRIGQAFIFADAIGFEKDSVLITVVNDSATVSSIIIIGNSHQISSGETLQLSAKAYNLNGEILENSEIVWSSSNNSILTINQNGQVTAIATGDASITASIKNIFSYPYSITVLGESRSGNFIKAPNQSHNLSGTVTLTKTSGENLVLSFGDDFLSSGGPDVRVYLSNMQGVNSSSLDVGSLKSTSGAQSYSIPSGVSLNDYNWVVVHCVPFNITFGYAQLQ